MSPVLNRSFALQCFKHGKAVEICNGRFPPRTATYMYVCTYTHMYTHVHTHTHTHTHTLQQLGTKNMYAYLPPAYIPSPSLAPPTHTLSTRSIYPLLLYTPRPAHLPHHYITLPHIPSLPNHTTPFPLSIPSLTHISRSLSPRNTDIFLLLFSSYVSSRVLSSISFASTHGSSVSLSSLPVQPTANKHSYVPAYPQIPSAPSVQCV